MKPRIRLWRTTWGKLMWDCYGRGHSCLGETPEKAYSRWVNVFYLRNRLYALKPEFGGLPEPKGWNWRLR